MQDLRWALRSLWRSPSFTLGAGLVLALAVGTTTAVFSVVNAVLIRALPYPDPDRLVAVTSTYLPPGRPPEEVATVALTDVERWRDAKPASIASMGAFAYTELPIRVGQQAFSPVTALVDPEFLPTLGIAPARGTMFPARGTPSADNSVIISHRLWTGAFGSSPDVIGRTISVDGEPLTVRGVMPEDFQFPRADVSYFAKPVDLIMPAAAFAGFPQDSRQWWGIARLRPQASLGRAREEMGTIARAVAEQVAADHGDWSATVAPLDQVTTRSSRPAVLVVLAIALVLLAIASSNVMNLLFSRGATRLHEMAIRNAMGCSTGRLVRQLLAESVLLSLGSGAAGLGLASIATNRLVALSPVYLPVTGHIGIDGTVLAFTFGVCLLTAVAAGLVPAVHAARTSSEAVRAPGSRATGGRGVARVQRALCIVQIALGLALLATAGALTGGLRQLSTIDPGFRSDSVVGFEFSVPQDHSLDERRRFYADALREVQEIPGVASAGLITFLPPETRAGVFMGVRIGDAPPPQNGAPAPRANHLITSEGYFATVGLRMVEGRPFTEQDDARAPLVLIVNQAFAHRYFPDRRVLGQHVGVVYDGDRMRDIIGVVGDSHDRGLGRAATPTVYIPFRQFALMYGAMAVRTHVAPTSLVPEIRRRLQRLDPAVPLVNFQTLDARIHASLDEPRFYAYLAAVCAAMAVLFVSLGLYGLIAFSVARRTQEFGIRMAIGASTGSITRLVLTQGALMASVGTLIGAGLALGFGRVLRALPFQVEPTSAGTVALAAALVVGVTLLACYLPARRASRVNPLEALRWE